MSIDWEVTFPYTVVALLIDEGWVISNEGSATKPKKIPMSVDYLTRVVTCASYIQLA
jgi:hypothetical protein